MPRPKRDLVRANYYLQTNVAEGLKRLAKRRATTVSDIVRSALGQYVLDELNKEAKHDADTDATSSGTGD